MRSTSVGVIMSVDVIVSMSEINECRQNQRVQDQQVLARSVDMGPVGVLGVGGGWARDW